MRRLRLSSHARALDALAQITAGQPVLETAKGHLRVSVNGALPSRRWPARLALCAALLALAWPAAAHAAHSQLCVLPIERGIVVCTNPSWYPAAKSKSYTEIHREGPNQLVTAAVEDDRTTYHRLVTILRHELFGHAVAGLHHNVDEPCSLLRPSYDPCMGDFTAHDLDLMLGGYR